MTAETDLLPCPFCGSPAEIDKGGFGEVFAACSKCWCHMGGAWSTTESDAIAAWNRRAIAAKDAEVEALRTEVAAVKESLSTELMATRAERDRAMEACQLISGHLAAAEARADNLRAEVERVTCELMDATTRADKLAEALRESADDLERGIDARIVVAQARAALKQEAGRG